MRKIYCRRLFLPSFILSIVSMCFLAFTTMFHNKQENIVSRLYNTQTNCLDSSKPSPLIQSSVPPHYLVIPYREFALRTSIACRASKLDNPVQDPAKWHPQYSKYLRGRFPYVIPSANITFDDIEDFYTKILVNKKNDSKVIDTSFAKNITFENIPYKFENGMWHPIGVTSLQRTAILIPLLGRDYNAKTFLLNMHAFVRRQQLTYTFVLIEQISPLGNQFNKGRLFNTAVQYLEKQSLNITCLILHDVDLIPEVDGNFYTCETFNPKHTTSRVRPIVNSRGYTRFYEFLIGGVLLLTFDMYKTLNGFSNLYWGWGGEDDDLALRLIQRRMCVVRPDYDLAIYVALPHPRGVKNDARFGLLTWTTIRLGRDGYRQVQTLTRIVSISQTPMVIHLKLDVDADGSISKSSSVMRVSSSVNKSNIRVASTNKALSITTTTKPS